VIVLALEGMSYAGIGQTLDISVANVGIRLNRAKSMLRTGLAHE
jgi:DNA-directed RNA polymerase specialized sigma24 family protein